jgi:phosphatidylglycerol---prolipoprotein diacylglyceryl transferase
MQGPKYNPPTTRTFGDGRERMYPTLFRIGSFEVTSFGLLVGIGALVGAWVFRRELVARGLPATWDAPAWVGLVGGLVGAKLLYTFEHLGEEPVVNLLLNRGGMSWFGGLVGGVLAGIATILISNRPLWPLLGAAAPALAVGQLFGRIGCFLVGDDYGRPSSLPWAVAFPEGLPPTTVPVHPTQIYEMLFLAGLTWLLVRARRRGVADRRIVALYLVLGGAVRFLLEFIRVNERVALGLTTAHWFALALIVIGLYLLRSPAPQALTAAGRSVPRQRTR